MRYLSLSSISVSYTHLDVYKRQLINMLIYYMMDKTNQMYQQVLQQEAISQQNEFYMQQIALTKDCLLYTSRCV